MDVEMDELVRVFKAAETAWCQLTDPPDVGLEEAIITAVMAALNGESPERATHHAIKYRTCAGSEIIVAVTSPLGHDDVKRGLFDFIMCDDNEAQLGFLTNAGRFEPIP